MSESTTTAVAVLSNDELNEVIDFDAAVAQAGLREEDMVLIASPYTVLNQDKDPLLATPFFIRSVRFAEDVESVNENGEPSQYCVLHVVDRANNMFVVTDGSTGIFKQIMREVEKRIENGHATPTQNFMVVNGLRKSTYKIGADNKPVAKGKPGRDAATYYFA